MANKTLAITSTLTMIVASAALSTMLSRLAMRISRVGGRATGRMLPPVVARHQTENTIQAIRAMLRTKRQFLTTLLSRPGFAMRHF
jgi:hypothetical protein